MVPAVLLGDGSDADKKNATKEHLESQIVVVDDVEVQRWDEDSAAPVTAADKSSTLGPFDVFLQKLPEAMNRDQIDECSERFCFTNNRGTRKACVCLYVCCVSHHRRHRTLCCRALYSVHWKRSDLLPYYAHLIATLYPVFPVRPVPVGVRQRSPLSLQDIGSELVRLLKNQFYGLNHGRSLNRLELKVRCVQFIGELVKFEVSQQQQQHRCCRHYRKPT